MTTLFTCTGTLVSPLDVMLASSIEDPLDVMDPAGPAGLDPHIPESIGK